MADTVPTPVSPKVKWSSVWAVLAGVGAAALTAGAQALDPHIFAQLGAFGPLLYTVVIAGASSLAGYLAKDALREAGQVAVNSAALPQAIYLKPAAVAGIAPATPPAPPATGSSSPVEQPAPEVPHAGTFAAPAAPAVTESTIQQ